MMNKKEPTKSLQLSKVEVSICYTAICNLQIKASDAIVMSKLLTKLQKAQAYFEELEAPKEKE